MSRRGFQRTRTGESESESYQQQSVRVDWSRQLRPSRCPVESLLFGSFSVELRFCYLCPKWLEFKCVRVF